MLRCWLVLGCPLEGCRIQGKAGKEGQGRRISAEAGYLTGPGKEPVGPRRCFGRTWGIDRWDEIQDGEIRSVVQLCDDNNGYDDAEVSKGIGKRRPTMY